MENSREKNKSEAFRRAQAEFNKYPPVKKFEKPSTKDDLTRIEISKSFMPHSEVPGNDR